MAILDVISSTDPLRLLTAAAGDFLQPPGDGSPFPSPSCLLVLRQGGLRDDLLALAAERGVSGWFDPPLCIFQGIADWLCDPGERPVPCGDYERVVLVSRAIERASALGSRDPRDGRTDGVFARVRRPDAFTDAVDRLFGELVSEGVGAGDLRAALESRGGRDDFERRRDHELATAYGLYLEMLAGAGRRDGRDTLVDCAAAVAADPEGTARRLGGRREIRLVGLQDLRGGWTPLLRTLVASPVLDRVRIYTAAPLVLPPDLVARRTRLVAGGADARDHAPGRQRPVVQTDLFAATPARPGEDVDATPDAAQARDEPRETASPEASDPAAPSAGAPAIRPGADVAFISAPDARRELEEVARRIRALLDAGVAPHRVAVVARQARPFTDLAVQALGRLGVPVTARRRRRLEDVPAVRAVLTLLAVAAEGWTRRGLVELADQPYLSVGLDPAVVDHIGYRRRVLGLAAWEDALAELLAAARVREARVAAGDDDEDDHRGWHPPVDRVERALARFRDFRADVAALEGERALTDWLSWLDAFIAADPWRIESMLFRVPPGRERLARIDAAGWSGVARIIREWRDALERWGGGDVHLEAAGFEARLRMVLAGDVALWTETRRGVQVLEALAASHRSFDHVFVVGLEVGRFPVAPRRSPIWDEREREQLIEAGLPLEPRAEWEARERALFHLLVSAARATLTLSWSREESAAGETVRSVFVDEVLDAIQPGAGELSDGDAAGRVGMSVISMSRVLTPDDPLVPDDATAGLAAHAAEVEWQRGLRATSSWDGGIERPDLLAWLAGEYGDDHLWSPTQIEAYAKCPWAFFSGRLLHLERREDPDTDVDARVVGSILHAALKRFYDAAVEREGGQPVLLREVDRDWAAPLLQAALRDEIENLGDDVWLGHPVLRETRLAELDRVLAGFLDKELKDNEEMFDANSRKKATKILRTAVAQHELRFENIVLDRGGIAFRYRGSIDRVEVGVDERIDDAGRFVAAADYKTSEASTPGGGQPAAWRDGVVLQVPLYAFALTRIRRGSELSRIEYRTLRSAKSVLPLQLEMVGQGEPAADGAAAGKMEDALTRVAGYVRSIREGRFPVSPAESCGCPPFCHAYDVCRIAGGPVQQKRGR